MLRRNLLEETCSKIVQFCNKRSLKDGICIHSPTFKLGVQDNLLLSNNLLSLYAKCCGVEHARLLFDEMPYRDVVSWTGVLSSYVKDGNHEEALRFFDLMKASGEKPNEVTFSNVLRSCSALGDFVRGARVQACVIKHAVGVFNAMENGDTVSWTAIISSLVQAGNRVRALQFFVHMIEEGVSPNEYTFVKLLGACSSLGNNYVPKDGGCNEGFTATSEQDVQLWTTVITGFTHNFNFQEAISAFRQMVGNNIVPNNYTYAGILNACSSDQALQLGKQIHTQLIRVGLENDISVGNALLDFYSKCSNAIKDVIGVFKGIPVPNVISWTTLIAGFAAHGLKDECFLAFLEMQFSGQQPNSFTLSYILQACGTTQSPRETRKIHGFIVKTNADNDVIVGNALVEAYAGSHMVGCALSLAKAMSNRTVITYTMLTSKLNQIGHHKTTLEIINHMRDDELPIDGFTVSSFLSASANLGATETGKQLHCYSIISGFCRWTSVLNGLIDFYGKCWSVVDAQKAFHEIFEPDIVSWNCLMHGFATNGHTTFALSTLEDMRLAEPQLNHYNLLIDLLGTAGRLEEAASVLKSMPFRPNASIYKRLFQACKLHRNVFLGEETARKGLELDPSDLEFYVLLAGIYDEAGRYDLGNNIRRSMEEAG
ncbi:UNVERIFIED_CONTAM: Pentatricopeptide repeat-containing protein, chloroplastic [Sesamum calycinum]|uniref:Pentatricopeptide repeat-containing protein, chloroplastic n=1 Tax=Sesamum calycinum TaxID=2727403 RepID=A0AAW2RQM7_9LAMI